MNYYSTDSLWKVNINNEASVNINLFNSRLAALEIMTRLIVDSFLETDVYAISFGTVPPFVLEFIRVKLKIISHQDMTHMMLTDNSKTRSY